MKRPFTGKKPRCPLPPGTVDTQMHLYPPGFDAVPGGPALPPNPPSVPAYRSVMQWLGIERVVVTQANAHQADNAALIHCLGELGDIARGVAVIEPGATREHIAHLDAVGVRGARIMDLPGGAVGLSCLRDVEPLIRDFDWVIAVQFDGMHIADHVATLETIEGDYIIDHHGKFFGNVGPDDPRIDTLKRLMDRGNCYFKLAGCYESSQSGPPDYADVAAVARAILAHAPDRVVWGTNWPHVLMREEADYPDDAALCDLVTGWIPEAVRRKVLVETPARLFDFT
ncbi:amidohydrolase family protein [Pararhizobium haloflavum]|uniref:amidohydrolase family protein n=1 Tax=Pararhizobium haloflavum TaxID=2037914 RepID=UPI000C19F4B4|nr:amidohydrolase family protein [Pararhizobium haloflavum]